MKYALMLTLGVSGVSAAMMQKNQQLFPDTKTYLDYLPPDLKEMCPSKILTREIIIPAIAGLDCTFPAQVGISRLIWQRPNAMISVRMFDVANRVSVSEPVYFSCDDTTLISVCSAGANAVDFCVKNLETKNVIRDYLCKEGEIFLMIRLRKTTEPIKDDVERFLTAHREFDRASSKYNLLINRFDWDCVKKKLEKTELNKVPFSDIIHAIEYDEANQRIILGSERSSCPALLYILNNKKEILKVAEYQKPCDSFRKLIRLEDGAILALHANGMVIKWNFSDESNPIQEKIFEGIIPQRQIWEPKLNFAGDISPDEKKLFMGIFNGQIFMVDLFAKKTREMSKMKGEFPLRAARFFPDNKTVVVSRYFQYGQMPVEIWDTEHDCMLAHTNGMGNALDINRDGTLIAIENSLWDVSFLKQLKRLSLKKVIRMLGMIQEKRKKRGAFLTTEDKFDIIAAGIESEVLHT